MPNVTEEESLLLQCLSMAALLAELDNHKFIESEYFKSINFANEGCKMILKLSGLGNPATMQMMLYALLVVPRELLSRIEYRKLERYVVLRINPRISSLVEVSTYSTYDNEESIENINYFRHIRNAVAHSKCKFLKENERNLVVFNDSTKFKQCYIKMECYKVGMILMELQKLIMEYYNDNHIND